MPANTELLTITVPEAGKRLRIGRSLAYEAARRGEIPTIRVGRCLRVPVRAFEKMLDRTKEPETAA